MTSTAMTSGAMRPVARLGWALLTSTALVGPALAQSALPIGGQVVSGGIAIGTPANGALAITQSSQNAIVNWQGFSIGANNRVDIRQPGASAAILNRVTGTTPSTIAGQLNANGQVYLVNPNGIAITRSGQVNAAGFVASSLGITNDDFTAGRRQFRGSGASASVANHGTITIGRGGYAALIGGEVANTGTIRVPMGRVGLGAGERATLDLSGDGFLQIAVPTQAKGRGALVEHSGTIAADGGSVTLTAAAARDMVRQAVNLSGVVEARSVAGRNGRITLSGGDGTVAVTSSARLDASGLGDAGGGRVRIEGRRLSVAGTVDVSGASGGRVRLKASGDATLAGRLRADGRSGPGGRVIVTAPAITTQAARIEASGATGGGTVRLGGGRQGQGRLAHAQTVDVDAATTIKADAGQAGRGGDVVVWSDAATRFAGTITARGGAQSGDGGEAEVSSKGGLAYRGHTDLTARKGAFGTLLLDPYDITISSGPDANQSGFAATGTGSVISAGTLLTALATANVTVSTGVTGSAGAQAGNITLAAATPLAWSSGATLTLQAAGMVTLGSDVTAAAGGLTIAAGTGSPSTATGAIAVARFTLASGAWVQNVATLPGFAAGDFQVAGGSFLRAAGGVGTIADPYRLADIYGLQGMGTSTALLAARYRLAGDIDAAGTAAWNAGAGFVPVGNDTTRFTGSLDGAGRAVTGVTINRPSQSNVGLIGVLGSGGTVTDLGLVGGSVTGSTSVGGLVGYNFGSIDQAYATGAVFGSFGVGGLIGTNFGSVTGVYATSAVSGGNMLGGLVGGNNGSLSYAYATGTVSGSSIVGGLIGYNSGSVTQAYATGAVSGVDTVGGLVGFKSSANGGALTSTYWDTETTGQANGVGDGSSAGATGLTSAQARTGSSYAGFALANLWYQAGDMRPILRSEAAPAVGGVVAVSNLHQLALMGADLAGRYRLTGSIDASATNQTANTADVFGTGGFVPVGNGTTQFAGSLDGAGYTVTGLTINRPNQDYVGLIGVLSSGGTMTGLGLVGGSITGRNNVGGLVGLNTGTLSQVYATGTVSGSKTVGGVVGFNFSFSSLSQAYATGAVSGSDQVGGLVGNNSGSASQAYATGAVSGSTQVGGLVGFNFTSITQAYATGSVSGGDRVGGLVGFNDGSASQVYATGAVSGSRQVGGLGGANFGTIDQAYATGAVTGSTSVGGLVGFNTNDLTSTYWDTETTGQANRFGSGSGTGGTGLTSAQARTGSSYAGFDLANVWYQAGDMRPILRSEAAPAVGGVVAVSNLHQLALMGADLAGRYRLAGPIDASATNQNANTADVFGAGGFVPVGNNDTPFTGSLDGAAYTVTGLTINRPNQRYVGLISSLGSGGTVTDLGLIGGSVSGSSTVGGLVGYNGGSVTQAYATGAVSGSTVVGGLIGDNFGSVTRAYATGAVSGIIEVGGLVGYNGGSVTQAYATGAASGSNAVGGLVGYNASGTISQAYATGTVSGSTNVGGLVGFNARGTLASTYWDTATTGQANGVGTGSSSGATGWSTAQMQDLTAFRTTYAGFDFTDVWAPPNQAGQGGQGSAFYPELYSFSKVVAVSPASTSRVYGDANPGLAASYAGVRAGDFVTTLGQVTTTATVASNAGAHAVNATNSLVTSATDGRYRIVYVPGTLTIVPRALTVMADAQGRVYGDANPPLTYRVGGGGLVNGDTLTGALASAATPTSTVGTYAITQGSLTAAANPNYAVTYQGANLTVGQRAVTVTADAQGRAYGDANPVLTYTSTSLGAGTTLAGGLTTVADATSNVGAYAITVGTLMAAANPNYVLTYQGANLTIGQRALTLRADAQSRAYGDANAPLTYRIGGSGLVNGDTLSGALATAAVATSDVGAYAIGQGSLAANPNYAVTYQGANLTVGQRALTLTADAQGRVYGDANPALTYRIGGSGLVNGDTLSGALTTAAVATSDAGAYAIGQGSLAASANYAVTYQGANLTVGQRALTLTADAQSRAYGNANPALTYRIGGSGLVNGDTLSGALATAAVATSDAGAYAIGQGSLAASTNYAVTYQGANLTVGQRALTLTADAQSRAYGDANPPLTYRIGGSGLVNGDTLSGALATAAVATSDAGAYAIVQGSLAASANYAVTYQGANLTVGQRALTLRADAQSRAYGDANPALTYRIGGSGLVNGDTLSGALATAAVATSDVGAYAIGQGSLAASANYAVTYQGADLTVFPRVVTVPPAAPPTTIAPDATGLASTAERVERRHGWAFVSTLPLRLDITPAGQLVASDPRFAATFVCTGRPTGACFLGPAPPPRLQADLSVRFRGPANSPLLQAP